MTGIVRALHHRVAIVRDAGRNRRSERPSREDACEIVDGTLRVGRDQVALSVQLERPVAVHLVEADGEELQELTRVVLVLRRKSRYSPIEGFSVISCNKVRKFPKALRSSVWRYEVIQLGRLMSRPETTMIWWSAN